MDSTDKKFFKWLAWILLGVLLLCVSIPLIVAYTAGPTNCDAQFGAFEHRWSFWGECQIKIQDKWVPAKNARFFPDGRVTLEAP